MRLKAVKPGFYIHRIKPGDEFEAPEGFSASWAKPCEKKEKEVSRKKKK